MSHTITEELLAKAEAFVRVKVAAHDASHDMTHIERVVRVSERLAISEGLPKDQQLLCRLSALLHDVDDYKYSGDEHATEATVTAHTCVAACLHLAPAAPTLDAIGAVGIARTLTFGGHFRRTLYDPDIPPNLNHTKSSYVNRAKQEQSTTLNHFYEKLFLLKDLMKTESGMKMAAQRHEFMESYVEQFLMEWQGKA
ncbi:MAG: hypothetical protein WDW38_008815 [Sanguina aurantia]